MFPHSHRPHFQTLNVILHKTFQPTLSLYIYNAIYYIHKNLGIRNVCLQV